MFSSSIWRSIAFSRLRASRAGIVLAGFLSFVALAQNPPSTPRETELLRRIDALEKRLAALEARLAPPGSEPPAAPAPPDPPRAAPAEVSVANPPPASLDPLRGTTFNMTLDGYYGYNFNRPAGRVNLLRAYDVLSNSFSLNQAAIIIERPADVEGGRRFGVRLDLQYGQATETLQGNAANEPRPQVYRPVFQAYGTYVAPLGNGLTVDFGKWASAFGVENNYTKDQLNYSRSYFFNFLPFYHFGFRSSYDVSKRLNLSYWLVNGVQQSEDFNGFKSQAVLLNIKPSSRLSWNVNYYAGIEDRDVQPSLNPGIPDLPTQPGLSANVIHHMPGRRLQILDTYATWNVTAKLVLAGEADYVVHRTEGPSARVTGGAAYVAYQFRPKFRMAARAEYLSDHGGLFSGATQALKETTVTADYRVVDGFLVRTEWRRDFSNQPFFLREASGLLKREQNTATLGLIWWFGPKQGGW
jgi:hypothetical protein